MRFSTGLESKPKIIGELVNKRSDISDVQSKQIPNNPWNGQSESNEQSTFVYQKELAIGRSLFVSRVLKYTCGGIGLSFATSAVTIVTIPEHFGLPFIAGTLLSFGSIFVLHKNKGIFMKDRNGHLYCLDPPVRNTAFYGLCAGMGILIAPFIGIFALTDPLVVPIAAGLSFGIMGTVSRMAMRSKSLSMLQYGVPLMGGVVGLIGIGLTGIGASLLGFSNVAAMLHQVDLYAGVAIFTGLIGYDIHNAIVRYEAGEPDHIEVSTNLFLDFINLFIRLMEIIAKARKN